MKEQKSNETMPDLHLGFARLTFTERDRKIFVAVALLAWVIFAAAMVNGFVKADVHAVLTNLGMLFIFSSFLLDRYGLRIFAVLPDSKLEKVLRAVQLLGMLIFATGWAYRLLY